MKRLPALALPLFLSACASDVAPEDRDFFYHGWRHPEQASETRMYGRKYVPPADGDESPRPPMPTANPPEEMNRR